MIMGIMTTVGLDINDWEQKPINAAAGNATYKDVRLASKGFGITLKNKLRKGVPTPVVKLTHPELIGANKKKHILAQMQLIMRKFGNELTERRI